MSDSSPTIDSELLLEFCQELHLGWRDKCQYGGNQLWCWWSSFIVTMLNFVMTRSGLVNNLDILGAKVACGWLSAAKCYDILFCRRLNKVQCEVGRMTVEYWPERSTGNCMLKKVMSEPGSKEFLVHPTRSWHAFWHPKALAHPRIVLLPVSPSSFRNCLCSSSKL